MPRFLKKCLIPLPGIKSHKTLSNVHKYVRRRQPRVVYQSENFGEKGHLNDPYRKLVKQIVPPTGNSCRTPAKNNDEDPYLQIWKAIHKSLFSGGKTVKSSVYYQSRGKRVWKK